MLLRDMFSFTLSVEFCEVEQFARENNDQIASIASEMRINYQFWSMVQG